MVHRTWARTLGTALLTALPEQPGRAAAAVFAQPPPGSSGAPVIGRGGSHGGGGCNGRGKKRWALRRPCMGSPRSSGRRAFIPVEHRSSVGVTKGRSCRPFVVTRASLGGKSRGNRLSWRNSMSRSVAFLWPDFQETRDASTDPGFPDDGGRVPGVGEARWREARVRGRRGFRDVRGFGRPCDPLPEARLNAPRPPRRWSVWDEDSGHEGQRYRPGEEIRFESLDFLSSIDSL